ncbi:MAG: DUF302 domain-containing protein [Pseudomonadota bacterium]
MTSLKPLVLSIGLAASTAACISVDNTRLVNEAPEIENNMQPKLSSASFEETRTRIENALEARGLTVFAVVDHAAGARAASLTLPENTLFIFGNPKAGTPLMAENPQLGLDLPLKISVYEDGDEVYVLSSDIRAITARAQVSEPAAVLDKIETVLAGIVEEATSN